MFREWSGAKLTLLAIDFLLLLFLVARMESVVVLSLSCASLWLVLLFSSPHREDLNVFACRASAAGRGLFSTESLSTSNGFLRFVTESGDLRKSMEALFVPLGLFGSIPFSLSSLGSSMSTRPASKTFSASTGCAPIVLALSSCALSPSVRSACVCPTTPSSGFLTPPSSLSFPAPLSGNGFEDGKKNLNGYPQESWREGQNLNSSSIDLPVVFVNYCP